MPSPQQHRGDAGIECKRLGQRQQFEPEATLESTPVWSLWSMLPALNDAGRHRAVVEAVRAARNRSFRRSDTSDAIAAAISPLSMGVLGFARALRFTAAAHAP
jgi:hypothetical protein